MYSDLWMINWLCLPASSLFSIQFGQQYLTNSCSFEMLHMKDVYLVPASSLSLAAEGTYTVFFAIAKYSVIKVRYVQYSSRQNVHGNIQSFYG